MEPYFGHLTEPWCLCPQLPSCPAATQSLRVLVAGEGTLEKPRRTWWTATWLTNSHFSDLNATPGPGSDKKLVLGLLSMPCPLQNAGQWEYK